MALTLLKELQKEFQFEILLIDVSRSSELTALYGNDIPVAVLKGRKLFKHRADKKTLQRMLRRRGVART